MVIPTPALALAVLLLAAGPVGAQVNRAEPSVPSWAAPPGGSAPAPASMSGPTLPNTPAAPVPLDGGLGLLAAAGAAYAARRFRARRGDSSRAPR